MRLFAVEHEDESYVLVAAESMERVLREYGRVTYIRDKGPVVVLGGVVADSTKDTRTVAGGGICILEVGRKYRNRKGTILTIIRYREGNDYPYVDNTGISYIGTGRCYMYRQDDDDLVEEVTNVD